ncbi:thioredoxin domain-containing protein [Thalassorhabdus alkalitolerans]|uniref:Thioredoxin domain-containing protein n=1 Tax=Thalassorhabdus alkalitolerans TaxID=2282697 RepID=A0ABW0YI84_9BACI
MNTNSENKTPNRLIHEKSPYLQQHAYNPVDWYPWGEEAFEKAKKENKPVFLSIGYSTCHWCHVMERESFEDEALAALLNDHFISIKVDREERPDLDSIYMSVCQSMAGRGGWPLNVFLNPDQTPFYAGTYFPKESRYGRPGFIDVITQLSDIFKNNPGKVNRIGKQAVEALQKNQEILRKATVPESVIHNAYRQLESKYDPVNGGFSAPPKFPSPQNFLYLLMYYKQSGEKKALEMTEKSLENIYRGGIHDLLGGGFARYSVDEKWLVPHFEKMLYDNALLASAYVETWQLNKKELYKEAAEDIFSYVLRDMKGAEGAFHSAEDADSEGMEGKFYVWTPKEVKDVLGEEEGKLFCKAYDITEEGNFEGKSIPNSLRFDPQYLSDEYNISKEEVNERLNIARKTLFEHRNKRVRPHKDDKILTSWNGLMIAALAKAGRAFGESKYTKSAQEAAVFLDENLFEDGRLKVRYKDGETANLGFIEDYANLLWGYIELYESTQQLQWLAKSKQLADDMIELFWDAENGGFFFYGKDQEQLLVNPKEMYDGAMPAGGSVAAVQFLRLARLTGETTYEKIVSELQESFAPSLARYPAGHAYFMISVLLPRMPMKEIVLFTGERKEDYEPLIKELQQNYHPESTFHIVGQKEPLGEVVPFIRDFEPDNEKPTLYVCEDFVCKQPITSVEEGIKMITKD